MSSNALKIVSWFALSLVLVPSLVFLMGMIGHDLVKSLALVGTLVWFPVTLMWMGRGVTGSVEEEV